MTIVAIVVGGGILAAIYYYVARFMRGSIKLTLPRTAFNPGDSITGSFDLQTKKLIQGNKLIASLIGTKVTKTYRDGKSSTHSHEIYRDEVLIEEATMYRAGHLATHEFELTAPNSGAPDFMNSSLAKRLQRLYKSSVKVARISSGRSRFDLTRKASTWRHQNQ